MEDLKNLRELLQKADELEVQLSSIIKDIKELHTDNLDSLKIKEKISEQEMDLISKYSEHRIELENSIIESSNFVTSQTDEYVKAHKAMLIEMDNFANKIKNYDGLKRFGLVKQIGGAIIYILIGYGIAYYLPFEQFGKLISRVTSFIS